MEPTRPSDRLGFEIAIICALTIEADAVEALFDHYWDDDGLDYEKAPGDPNAYSTGSIGRHNVVLAWMPDMGKVSSARVAVNCRISFPNIKLALVVGICGAVPFIPKTNIGINLGDVILSRGIVQYDLGRRLPERFTRKDTIPEDLGRPNGEIRSLLAKLEGLRARKGLRTKTITYLGNLQREADLQAEYPGVQHDKLFKAMYRHVSDGSRCEECGCSGELVVRARYSEDIPQPAIHFGLIASGDAIMRCGVERDEIANQEGVIGFEMEGAGVWDTFPCVVIKGACDYADSHKTKIWQRYAAATAAACTKAFLRFWIPATNAGIQGSAGQASLPTKYVIPYTQNPDFVGRSEILNSLTDHLEHTRKAQDAVQGRASLYGLGGTGKTQIALEYIFQLQQSHPNISIFWVHASSTQRFRQGFASIAQAYEIPGYTDPKLDIMLLVKSWLAEKTHGEWLIIIDNADDTEVFFGQPSDADLETLESLETKHETNLAEYLPECAHGTFLITTRNKQTGLKLTKGRGLIEVPRMNDDEAVELLRSSLRDPAVTSDDLSALSCHLEHLPLALAQAAAYIRETTITVGKYLQMSCDNGNEKNMVHLLSKEFETVGRDSQTPQAVARTWMLSFQQIERQNPLASKLLSFMSLLDRHDIPEEFLSYYSEYECEEDLVNEIELIDALGILKAFSFVTESILSSFTMHRLVQLVTRKWLTSRGSFGQFSGQALRTVANFYPMGRFETRDICTRYLPHANMVLKESESILNDETEARACLLHCVSQFHYFQGQFDDAEKAATCAVSLRKVVMGFDHPDTLNIMSDLASIYHAQGSYEAAENLGVQVIDGQKKRLGADHPDTMTSIGNLATTFVAQERWDEAEENYITAMKAQEETLGANHQNTLRTKGNLAELYGRKEQWEAAESLTRQVIEARKKILGADHPDTLSGIANLARLLQPCGRLEEAEKLFIQVVQAQKTSLGAKHSDTLSSINNLAVVYVDQGRFDEAENLVVQVIEAQTERLGADHPDTLTSISNLAAVFLEQDKVEEAEKLYLQVIETETKRLGADHLDTLVSVGNLAMTLMSQERWEEAELLGIQVMETRKKKLGTKNLDTLTSMGNLAAVFAEQGRWEEAGELYKQVIEAQEEKLGGNHQTTLLSKEIYASKLLEQGKHLKEAEALEIQVTEARREILGDSHPDTLTSMSNLASVLGLQERWEEAEKLDIQVLEIRRKTIGPDHPDTLISMGNLAHDWRAQGRHKEALELMVMRLEAHRRDLGSEHPTTIATMSVVDLWKAEM